MTRRTLLVPVIGLVLALPLGAQVTVGGMAGLNVTTNTSSKQEFNTINQLIVGATVNIPVSGAFAIQAEVLFSRKGADLDTDGGWEGGLRIDYLGFPILARIGLRERSSRVLPSVYAGPVFSFETSCNREIGFDGVRQSVSCNDAGFDTKSLDLGLALGGGLGLKSGPAIFTLDARFNLGITDIRPEGETVRNRTFSLLGGVAYRLGGP